MTAFCTCLDEFGANPPDDPCPLHDADVPVCSNGDADCAAAEDNWCCPACWSDRKDATRG